VNNWGLGPVLDHNAVRLQAIVVKRWQDGKELAVAPAMPKIEQIHGAPQYVVHRPELLNTFLEGGLALPTVTLRTGAHVETVDFDTPSVTLRNGETYKADVVIAADGLKSVCRAFMFEKLGLVDKARPTGDAAYRIVIPAATLLPDPELRQYIQKPIGYAAAAASTNTVDYDTSAPAAMSSHIPLKEANSITWFSLIPTPNSTLRNRGLPRAPKSSCSKTLKAGILLS